jgi:galactokinase
MTDDTDDTYEFTTDGSPGEQAFESTVDDAVGFFEAAFDANERYYGARMAGALRGCVRTALASDGSVSPEQVAHELSDQAGQDADVEPVLRRIEEMVDECGAAAGTGGGRHG